MPVRTVASPVYILVIAPPALLPLYSKEQEGYAPLKCVTHAHDAMKSLNEDTVAAVICHEAPRLDPEAEGLLAAWYSARRTHAPLLAVVADLAPQKRQEHPLYPHASLLLSRYHSRPHEIIALLRQWAFPPKSGKRGKV